MQTFAKWLEATDPQPTVLYHVTMIRKLPSIRRSGLKPDMSPAFTTGVYPSRSRGKVFLADAEGVGYWMHKVEYAEFDQFDDPKGVAVLTVNVSGLKPQKDDLGSEDSRHGAYFVAGPIPPDRIVNVQEHPAD